MQPSYIEQCRCSRGESYFFAASLHEFEPSVPHEGTMWDMLGLVRALAVGPLLQHLRVRPPFGVQSVETCSYVLYVLRCNPLTQDGLKKLAGAVDDIERSRPLPVDERLLGVPFKRLLR